MIALSPFRITEFTGFIFLIGIKNLFAITNTIYPFGTTELSLLVIIDLILKVTLEI